MQAVAELFKSASDRFQDNHYFEGLDLITRCIDHCPRNSLLYSNRALFHAQLGDLDCALNDLNHSISLNHLNYVAYFNLFSLQYRSGEEQTSFDNLCCSLSCLYLIRAKKSRRQLDLQRSIKYAQNNLQSHVLKSLMYLQDGKFKLALNQIEWAIDINPHSVLCKKLRNVVNKKLNPQAVSEFIDEDEDYYDQTYRLHTTYEVSEEFAEEILARVKEFNEIYEEVNAEYGTVAQKVPRIIVEGEKNMNDSRSKILSEISDIYEIKYRDNHTDQNVTLQKTGSNSDGPTKEQLPNDNNEESLLLLDQQNDVSLERQTPGRKDKVEEIKQVEASVQQENLLDDSLHQHNRPDPVPIAPITPFVPYTEPLSSQDDLLLEQNDKVEEYLLEEKKPANPILNTLSHQKQKIITLIEQPHPKPEQLLLDNIPTPNPPNTPANPPNPPKEQEIKPPLKTTPISRVSDASSATNESISLYPILNKKKIQFTIMSAELKNPSHYKDLYLTGNYNSRKGQRLKTPIKKIDGNTCRWFSASSPTPISEIKQTVSVKVYNKQYFGYTDDLIGEGQVEIIRSGDLKFPIYYKNKTTGFVSLRVDLI